MPKVLLTHEQKLEDRNIKLRNAVADNLAVTKRRTGMNMEEMGAKVGISRNAMSKLLSGEDVTMSMSSLIRIIDLAGLTLKRRTEESL
jgi:transcriptional regulator with XRE-family HTH domain